ncbi:MAG: hypothetical protein PVH88_01555 [Ignavibacteria bacterium]
MRLHKENTGDYLPFYKSLQDIDDPIHEGFTGISIVKGFEKTNTHMLEKYSHMFQNLSAFDRDTSELKSVGLISEKLNYSLKRILPVKDSAILVFDDTYSSLELISKSDSQDIVKMMNHFYTEGILNLLFETGKPMLVPELSTYNSDGPKLNYILYPIFEENKKFGLLSILTTVGQNNFNEMDKECIRMLLNLTISKIKNISLKEKLSATYEDLHTYQAKLSNDFRLAAIGELTQGIIENLLSPMQVIVSNVEMIESDTGDNEEIKQIKAQLRKINLSIGRLVKFANVNQNNNKIQPCNINEVIGEYYNLVKSTLDSVNLELVLDFEKNIPSILSHQNYIFQLMTNILGIIKNKSDKDGGIIIQTRFKKDHILLKVITTSNISKNSLSAKSKDLNIRIIENLMKKHEGAFAIDNFNGTGSALTLKFPLRRKIRK